MRANQNIFFIFLLLAAGITGCKKETEKFESEELSAYMPLAPGKYITYRLDSTVFLSFGTVPEIHSFQEKHVVDALLTDGLGRPSYRVFRFMRDTNGTQSWTSAGTYFITPTAKTIEVIENNLRIVKLVSPITPDNTWKGNRFLPDDPYAPLYGFQNDQDMEDWDYTYASTEGSVVLNGQTLNNILTVNGIDRVDNVPVMNTNIYGSIDYIRDQYAKGIGLVSQEWIMWDFQPPHDNIPVAQKHGFGIKRTMIDHN